MPEPEYKDDIEKRLEIDNEDDFVEKVIIEQDVSEYPDPFIREYYSEYDLKEYLARVREVSDRRGEICRRFARREQIRVNTQIGRINTSTDEHLVEKVKNCEFKSYGSLGQENLINLEGIKELCKLSIEELRELAIYFRHEDRYSNAEICYDSVEKNRFPINDNLRLVNAIRFAKGDKGVSLENFVFFRPLEDIRDRMKIINEETGEEVKLNRGVEFDVIKENIRDTIDKSGSRYLLSISLAFIGCVTNYSCESSPYGETDFNMINFAREFDFDDYTGTVYSHELFHAVQFVLDILDLNTAEYDSSVNIGAPPSDWDKIVFENSGRINNAVLSIREDAIKEWFKMRTSQISPIREYQTKNYNEMLAVAFELYVENPNRLRAEQESLYHVIDETMSLLEP